MLVVISPRIRVDLSLSCHPSSVRLREDWHNNLFLHAVTHRLPPPDKCCVPFALHSAVKHIVHLSILLWSLAASINIFGPRSTKLLALRFETLLQAPVAYQRSIAHSGQLAPPPFPISFATGKLPGRCGSPVLICPSTSVTAVKRFSRSTRDYHSDAAVARLMF